MEYHHLNRSRTKCAAGNCTQRATWQITHDGYGVVELCRDHLVELLNFDLPKLHYLVFPLPDGWVGDPVCGHKEDHFVVTRVEAQQRQVTFQLCEDCANAVADALEDQSLMKGKNYDET